MSKIGIAFSNNTDTDPFIRLGKKRSVYEDLIMKCVVKSLSCVVVTTRTYKGNALFKGFWEFIGEGHLKFRDKLIKLDLVYDRSASKFFPAKSDTLRVVDNYDFKRLSCDKWLVYKEIGEYMPKTYWIGRQINLMKVLPEVRTDFIVLKPNNGLKGLGIFIGSKVDSLKFDFLEKRPLYIAQEFVDTKKGIEGIVSGFHDLRMVVINQKIVWSHVRTPSQGNLKANVAQGGRIMEVDTEILPEKIKQITQKIAKELYTRYDNPLFSVDFGVDANGKAFVFEINDQVGFPKPGMRAKDLFLDEMIVNFKSKIK